MRRARRRLGATCAFAAMVTLGCGGTAHEAGGEALETVPSEPTLRGRLRGTTAADPGALTSAEWRYVEGTCTEGILDMSVRGFAETLAVHEVPGGLLFVADRHFEVDTCSQTVRFLATQTPEASAPAGWFLRETARVAYPDSPRCEHVAQEDAPGEVRMRGSRLELFVRRAAWCGGYEARLVYERERTVRSPTVNRTLRHFVAAFHDRDSLALVDLYTPSGYHEDPHRPDAGGRPGRHVGRDAVGAYFAGLFHQVPWLAFRLREASVSAAEAPLDDDSGERGRDDDGSGHRALRVQARVEYMDPRLLAPREGLLELSLIDGRVFASRLRLQHERPLGSLAPDP